MRWLRFAVLILLAAILQASLFADLNIRPDLLSILLVFFAIYCNISEAIITSFTIGFAADLIGPAMGPQMLSYGLFGTALAYLHRVITIKRMPHQALAIFITVLLADAVAYFLAFLKGQPIAPNIHTALLGISLYSSLVGPFLFLPSAWWIRIKTNRVRRSLR
ncbi:MAG: rod shape-determining protein MreD [Planctomycetota bacterium]|nr:rod shape-determining protein MreD [Planctomycetota bacterium]